MPRRADERLESRIVDAAYQLWSQGGEHALTMRAVAKAAKTTTPTMYERFRDKHDLIEFLRERARQKIFAALQPADSALDVCRLGLGFTLTFGNEYILLTADWSERLGRNVPLPSFEFLKSKLAHDLGGRADDHEDLALALVSQVHGTAILLQADAVKPQVSKQLQRTCLKACEALIEDARRKIPLAAND
jgi:AcrR family transcriptional regulator